jgi:DNA-binding SARP family transcriptional activator
MSHLSIALLGAPEILIDGAPLRIDTRKAIALLAWLAVFGGRQSRETLAARFWPESDSDHARSALRRTLSTLNSALEGRWLAIDRAGVALVPDASVTVDVVVFRERLAASTGLTGAAEIAALEVVVALYRDDFMAGFGLRDCPEFDDWVSLQSEQLRRELAVALERLASAHLERGAYQNAIACGLRWLALDRLHEPAHRFLMQAHVTAGDRSAALRQYHACVQILDEELGVAPLPPTIAFYEAILEHQHASVPPIAFRDEPHVQSIDVQLPAGRGEWCFVGRDAELNEILDAYNRVARNGWLVAIDGEAGVGKTRLAEEVVGRLRNSGARALSGRSYDGEESLAFGPWVATLRQAAARDADWLGTLADRDLAEAARLVPELRSVRPGLHSDELSEPSGARLRLFEGVVAVLAAALAGPIPGVLLLDDAHWADQSSLDLLAFLIRRLDQQPIFVLVTFRGESITDNHPLRRMTAGAARTRLATRIQLPRLDHAAVSELVRQASEDRVVSFDRVAADQIFQDTEGLPFLVIDALDALVLAGASGQPALDRSISSGARDLFHSRLASVRDAAWQVLSTAAALGRSFDFESLRDASGRSEDEVLGSLETLIERRLVTERTDAGTGRVHYDFVHGKLRRMIYEEMTLTRRRLLHRRIAEALLAHGYGRPAGELAARVAHHYQLGGLELDAAEQYRLAGEYARGLFANREALEHFRAALDLGHPDRAVLLTSIGDILTLLGDYAPAHEAYQSAMAADQSLSSQLGPTLGRLWLRMGDTRAAERAFEESRDATSDPAIAAEIEADWSLAAHRGGAPERARVHGETALCLAEQAGDQRAIARARNALGILARQCGDLEEADRQLSLSLALAETLGDISARTAALNNLALLASARGEYDRAIARAQSALDLADARGDRHRQAALHSNLADFFQLSGHPDLARLQLQRSVAIFAEIATVAGEPVAEIWKLVEW